MSKLVWYKMPIARRIFSIPPILFVCSGWVASPIAYSASNNSDANQVASAPGLHAAVTPTTTSALRWHDRGVVQKRYFATILNDSDQIAKNCSISLTSDVPLELDFYATHPLNNEFIGPINGPVNIPARGRGTFGFTLTLTKDRYFPRQRLTFAYACENRSPAATIPDVNDVRLGGGTEPTPSVVISLMNKGLPGIMHLASEVDGDPCIQINPQDRQLAPCAMGTLALALHNLELDPVTVTIDVPKDDFARVQQSWICRVDENGECTTAWTMNTPVRPTLGPAETALFAVKLLTFDDYSLRPPRYWRHVQVSVVAEGKRGGVPRRVEGHDLKQLRTKRFEWQAKGLDGAVKVHGSILLKNLCKRAQLRRLPMDGPDAGVLHLEVSISDDPDIRHCTPGLVKQTLALTVEATEIREVWVDTERGTLKLAVTKNTDT